MSEESQPRMLWMDVVRGAAILAVIAFHSVTFLERYDFEANMVWRQMNESLSLYRMPILVFLSGMLLTRSLAKPAPEFLSGKIRAILWPFLLWSTVYGVVAGVDLTSLYQLRTLYIGGSHLWFLAFIFVYYVVAKPLESVNPLIIATCAFLLAIISPDGAKYSERILYLMALFFLGGAISGHTNGIVRVLRSQQVWFLLPVIAASSLLTVLYDLNFGPSWVIISVTGILFFSSIALRIETLALSKPLIWIGQRAIVFFVSHAIFIMIVGRMAEAGGVENYPAVASISIVTSLVCGWALAVGMDRSSLIAWLFRFPKQT